MAELWLVDVFTRQKYTGNQLAVVLDRGEFDDVERQRIAREMNFSETTFLDPEPGDGAFRVRIFTPTSELPYAGHPTLGTAMVVRNELLDGDVGSVTLELSAGRVPVEFESAEIGWLTPPAPVLGARHDPRLVAEVLGLTQHDLDDRFPVQTMGTPFPFTFVPLRSVDALSRAGVDLAALKALAEADIPQQLYPFAPTAPGSDVALRVRLFAPLQGIAEDPATGSAAGALAAYAAEHRMFGAMPLAIAIEQGVEMGRPSRLELRAEPAERGWRVQVGGGAVLVARGQLL